MRTHYLIAWLGALSIASAASATGWVPHHVEEFDNAAEFVDMDLTDGVYIADGRVYWRVERPPAGDMQYVYRSIPPVSSWGGTSLRITVTGKVDGWINNSRCLIGLGNLADGPGSGLAVTFGFYGGGCSTQGAVISGAGMTLDHWEAYCNFWGNWLWISPGTNYTAILTLNWTPSCAVLEVPGVGVTTGTPGSGTLFNILYVGNVGDGQWGASWGTIESVTIETCTVGCGLKCRPVSVESSSWGQVKGLYR